MKKDKKQTLRAMKAPQLQVRLEEISKEIVDLKMKLYTGALKNVRSMAVLKQERAIIKTLLQEKAILEKAN